MTPRVGGMKPNDTAKTRRRWTPVGAGRTLRRARGRAGSATVEFVVLAPFILAFAVIALEFGRVMIYQQTMSHALRGGAQYLSRMPVAVLQNGGGCASGPLDRAVNVVLNGDPTDSSSGAIAPWWTDRTSITCSLTLIDSDTVATRRELWVVELRASVAVELPLLRIANTLVDDELSTVTIAGTERARVIEELDSGDG